MFKEVVKFLRDEEGASAIEYGLIVGLIAVVMIAALLIITGPLGDIWNDAADQITTASNG